MGCRQEHSKDECAICDNQEWDAQCPYPSKTPSAGPVGSSGLLVPASPAPTARPDRFTAGPIGARDASIYKSGFVCCEHNYHCETIEFMVRHCKNEHH